ncbi:MAG: response regulator [Candidatus Kapabacteria bacterium]|nr:response regulator [Candidatus Kapabacteria bacterium]
MKRPIIICVDDEKIVLDSLKKELNVAFKDMLEVEIAESAAEALELISDLLKQGYEIPIIISDWLMPEMKGDELLIKIHGILPETKKIMLTGQATTEGVGNAVNNAKLYRYIAKPWQQEDLDLTVTEAFKIYYKDKKIQSQQVELVKLNESLENKVKERTKELEFQKEQIQVLLNKTLEGFVSTLINVVSSSNIEVFSRSIRAKEIAKRIIFNIEIEDAWEFEIASLLCQIGCLDTNHKVVEKYLRNEHLDSKEMIVFLKHPIKTYSLISRIPHFGNVSKGILNIYEDAKLSKFSFKDAPQEIKIAKILRFCLDFDKFRNIGNGDNEILALFLENLEVYDIVLINAIKANNSYKYGEVTDNKIIAIQIKNLKVGMKLSANIKSLDGKVLINSEEELTQNSIMNLVQTKKRAGVEEPIFVYNQNL